jgi:hypothetical protein
MDRATRGKRLPVARGSWVVDRMTRRYPRIDFSANVVMTLPSAVKPVTGDKTRSPLAMHYFSQSQIKANV